MRHWLVLALIFSTQSVIAADSEALTVRRIAALWRDGDHELAQRQMEQFLKEYPASSFSDTISIMLGDAYLEAQSFDKALAQYSSVTRPDLVASVRDRRLQAMMALGRYSDVVDELTPLVQGRPDPSLTLLYARALTSRAQQVEEGEERNALYRLAKERLESMAAAQRKDDAVILLAELQRVLGSQSEAAILYHGLATRIVERREEFLWEAARCELDSSQGKALATLREIQGLHGPRAADAAFTEAVLLSENSDASLLIGRYETLAGKVTSDKKSILDYLAGRAYHLMEKDDEALNILATFLETATDPLQRKQALLMALQSARRLGRVAALETLMTRFISEYPDDPQVAKALYLQAELYQTKGNTSEALSLLDRIAKDYPGNPLLDQVAMSRIRICRSAGEDSDVYEACIGFLQDHSGSPLVEQVYPVLVDASLKTSRAVPTATNRSRLVEDVRLALAVTTSPSDLERQYLLILAETLSQLERYTDATATLEEFFALYPTSTDAYQAHFLMALSQLQGTNNLDAYIFHGEKVLELKPDFDEVPRLRHNLAAAYYQKQDFDRAAEHLFLLVETQSPEVDQNNLLWLVNYAFERLGDRSRPHLPVTLRNDAAVKLAQRALAAYTLLDRRLRTDGTEFFAKAEDTPFEQIQLQRISILAGLQRPGERLKLAQELCQAQKKYPQLPWQTKANATFALAAAQEAAGDLKLALDSYSSVAEMGQPVDKTAIALSGLQWARLAYFVTPIPERTLTNPNIQDVLAVLEELQTHKDLTLEPIHLEAALDRVEYIVELTAPAERETVCLALLQKVKEDFTTSEEIVSRDYHRLRAEKSAYDALYQSYMMLIDGQIAYLQACKGSEGTEAPILNRRYDAARTMLTQLAQRKAASTDYVVAKAKKALTAIEQQRALTELRLDSTLLPQTAPQWRVL